MPIWKPDSVEIEPQVIMTAWEVIEVERPNKGKTRHVVGYCGEGRVSSTIIHFDTDTRVATTRSGRKYCLPLSSYGNIGSDAQYVLNVWKSQYFVTNCEVVSNDYL
jgi:hypothetical protein